VVRPHSVRDRTRIEHRHGCLLVIDRAASIDSIHRPKRTAVRSFRGIALLARTADGWGVPDPGRAMFRWSQPWPTSSARTFPPVTAVGDDNILTAVVRQDGATLPQVACFLRDPGELQQQRN
jgi:hypothetical protein